MRRLTSLLMLAAVIVASRGVAQTVIWTTDSKTGIAVGVAGLMDQMVAEQERLRTTPMVHRKIGIKPTHGEEVLVKPGEVIVARIAFRASYLARPRADFVNTQGIPVQADSLRAIKMLNNRFCLVGGGFHCFADNDRDGDWDGAAQAKGRWLDVPYEIFELREEIAGDDRREVVLISAEGPALEYRELYGASLVTKAACSAGEGGHFKCGALAVKEIGREGDALRFLIE